MPAKLSFIEHQQVEKNTKLIKRHNEIADKLGQVTRELRTAELAVREQRLEINRLKARIAELESS